MGLVVWLMTGLALWHFTIFLPDRFWGGIIGVFAGASLGAMIGGFLISGLSVPTNDELSILTTLEAIPGSLIGMAVVYFEGVRRGEEPA